MARAHPDGTAHPPHWDADANTGAGQRPGDWDCYYSWMNSRCVNEADEVVVVGVVGVTLKDGLNACLFV